MKYFLIKLMIKLLLKLSSEKELMARMLALAYPGNVFEVTIKVLGEGDLDDYFSELVDEKEEEEESLKGEILPAGKIFQ